MELIIMFGNSNGINYYYKNKSGIRNVSIQIPKRRNCLIIGRRLWGTCYPFGSFLLTLSKKQ